MNFKVFLLLATLLGVGLPANCGCSTLKGKTEGDVGYNGRPGFAFEFSTTNKLYIGPDGNVGYQGTAQAEGENVPQVPASGGGATNETLPPPPPINPVIPVSDVDSAEPSEELHTFTGFLRAT